MKYSHDSEQLNKLCGKIVEITFFDGDICTGKLKKHEFGAGYCLKCNDGHSWVFQKSHVKRLKEV